MPDPLAIETAKYRAKLKRKASEGTEKPEKIIRTTAAQFSTDVSAT